MLIKLKVYDEQKILVSIARGELTSDDVYDHMELVLLNPDYEGMDLICDARNAELVTHKHTADRMRDLLGGYRAKLVGRRWAIIVEGMLQGTAGWLFMQMAKSFDVQVKIFSEEQTAMDWILEERQHTS